jgi:hypothetical protein
MHRQHRRPDSSAGDGLRGTRRFAGIASRLSVRFAFAACLLAVPAAAQDFGGLNFLPIAATGGKLVFSFDQSVEGWQSLDGGNGLGVETEAGAAKEGKGALKYQYVLKQGVLSILCRGGLSVAGVKSVSFWVKGSRPGVFGLGLIEKDGSNYFTTFRAAAGEWQQVTCDVDELQLADDSKDENGALDVDQIHLLGLIDIEALTVQKTEVKDASRTVWIDEVTFSPKATHPTVEGGRAVLDDFEKLSGRWAVVRFTGKDQMELDAGNGLKIATEAGNVKEGKGALEYHYQLVGNGPTALMSSLSLRLKNPRSVSAWIKTSEPSMIAWTFSERDGSSYMAPVFTSGGEWQFVKLGLGDFSLDEHSKDENGQLDGGQISSVGFIDAAAMFGGLGAEPGATRTLWIDELAASDEEPAARQTTMDVEGGKLVRIDDFEQGAPAWVGFTLSGFAGGKPTVTMDKGTTIGVADKDAAAGKGALQVSYFAPEASLFALLRFWGKLPLTGVTQLRFSLKSKFDAKLMVSVEERDGSGYNLQLDATGGEKWQQHQLPLAGFTLGDDKVDENGKLDSDQLKQVSLIDMSGAVGEPGQNVLWLDEVAFFVPAGK